MGGWERSSAVRSTLFLVLLKFMRCFANILPPYLHHLATRDWAVLWHIHSDTIACWASKFLRQIDRWAGCVFIFFNYGLEGFSFFSCLQWRPIFLLKAVRVRVKRNYKVIWKCLLNWDLRNMVASTGRKT